MLELERVEFGVRSFASVQGALAMYPIFAVGSEDQKRTWLPKMARGEVIGCFGLTEPDFGSNPAGMITMAQEQSDGTWLLNGGKMWITNGSTAQIAIVWAKTNGDKSERSIRGFQRQQELLADMLTEIPKAQLVSLHLGRLKDKGNYTPQQVSLAKRNNVDMATDVAREARRLLGAVGILAEYASMRHMANLESVYTYEGTHDVHSLVLGQAITGLNAFK